MMMRSPIATRKSSRKQSSDSNVFGRDETAESQRKQTEPVAGSCTSTQPTGSHGDVTSPPGDVVTGPTSGQGRVRVQRLEERAYKPFGSRSRASSIAASDAGSEAALCICKGGPGKVCGEPVRNNDLGVQCDKCDKWYHTSCQGISQPAYDAINEFHKVLFWLCPACKDSLKGTDIPDIPNPAALESKMDELVTAVDTRMMRIEQSLREQEQTVNRQTKLI